MRDPECQQGIPTSRSDRVISGQFIVLNEVQSDPIVLTILGLNSKLCFRDCSQVLMPGKIFKLRPSLTDSGTWKSVGQKNLRDEYLNRTANFVLFYDFKMKCRLVLNLCWYWSVSKVLLVLMMLTSVDVEAFKSVLGLVSILFSSVDVGCLITSHGQLSSLLSELSCCDWDKILFSSWAVRRHDMWPPLLCNTSPLSTTYITTTTWLPVSHTSTNNA